MDFSLLASNHCQRFPKIGLRASRRMHQRHEHFPLPQLSQAYVVLHDGVPTAESALLS